jgi:two-component system sensor histidine kinase RegB
MTPAPVLSPAAINLKRLVGLRTITLSGQALAVWVAVVNLRLALPLFPLVAILAGMALINLATWWRIGRAWPVAELELFAQLTLDVAALTALLYFTGGSTNPFAPLYLLPLTLTAAALPRAHTWVMAGLSVACYSALLFVYVPLPQAHGAHGDDFQMHVLGMWLGFLLSAGLIAWFAVRMADTLRERDRLAAAMREQELKHERVLALGTLAAGAAHEFGTPLATMAVLVRDMQPGAAVAGEKLKTLRGQIDRCKEILFSLSAAAGQVRAESGASRPLDIYLDDLVDKWLSMRPGVLVRRHFRGTSPAPRIVAEQTLSQAILNILNNAADVSPQQVEVDGRWNESELRLEIADRGPGLAPEVAQHPGEPFQTTKSEGLGLGLFLAYTTLQRLGGGVQLVKRDGGGVLCRLTLPLAPILVSPPETETIPPSGGGRSQ